MNRLLILSLAAVLVGGCKKEGFVDPPKADFYYNTYAFLAGANINFIDLSTNAVSYSWDFGDGTGSSEENPIHRFADTGSYNVSLTVKNEKGATDTKLKWVQIHAYHPKSVQIHSIKVIDIPFKDAQGDTFDWQPGGPDVLVQIRHGIDSMLYETDTKWDVDSLDLPFDIQIADEVILDDFSSVHTFKVFDDDSDLYGGKLLVDMCQCSLPLNLGSSKPGDGTPYPETIRLGTQGVSPFVLELNVSWNY